MSRATNSLDILSSIAHTIEQVSQQRLGAVEGSKASLTDTGHSLTALVPGCQKRMPPGEVVPRG